MKWTSINKLENIENIAIVEKELKIKFSSAFKKIIIDYNNGMIEPCVFDTIKQKGLIFGRLLNFNQDSNDYILKDYIMINDKLPENVIPFAYDPGGNYLCFDYRNNETNPPILYWDHEQKFKISQNQINTIESENITDIYELDLVADNLEKLLAKLYKEKEQKRKPGTIIWEGFMDEDELKDLSDDELVLVNKRRRENGLPPILK